VEIKVKIENTYNIKDTGSMKQAAKQLAQNGFTVETIPVPTVDPTTGRNKVNQVNLVINGEVVGSQEIKWLKEAEYLEDFVILVEKYKAAPTGNADGSVPGGMTTLIRGRIGMDIREKILEDHDNGISVEDLASKYCRTKQGIEKVISEGLAV
jgi:hypothetical protein